MLHNGWEIIDIVEQTPAVAEEVVSASKGRYRVTFNSIEDLLAVKPSGMGLPSRDLSIPLIIGVGLGALLPSPRTSRSSLILITI